MNTKRLLKLADFLDTLPRQKFDFGIIASEGGKPMLEALKADKHRCGTVACAIGWMPAVFPRYLKWTGGRYPNVCFRDDDSCKYDFEVAEAFFGVTENEAIFLFAPNNGLGLDATPEAVAKHIRKFVREKQREAANV